MKDLKKKWMKQNMKIDTNKVVSFVIFNHSRSKFQPNLAQVICGFKETKSQMSFPHADNVACCVAVFRINFLVIHGFSVSVCNDDRNFLNIETLKDVKAGDCLVCFSKAMIYKVCIELEKLGHNVAVIYGSLPPGRELVDE